jgi:Amt family ammonium transporter
VGLLYSGFSRSHHALSIILICCLCYAVVSIQWVIWGFSLGFSETSTSPFIGNLDWAGLEDVSWNGLPLTAPAIPAIAFSLFQLQFATVTVALIFGSVIERIRIAPSLLFMFVWTTVVYDPIAYWTWSAHGWIRNLDCLDTIGAGKTPCLVGGLDFAGGGPVHIASGTTALAFCIFLGRRKNPPGVDAEFKAHSVTNIFLGTALLWMGWFGFNVGSALAATSRAANAAIVTTIAAPASALAWSGVDYFHHARKFSSIAFCSGAIAGLVGITPASGFVNAAWSSPREPSSMATASCLGTTLRARLPRLPGALCSSLSSCLPPMPSPACGSASMRTRSMRAATLSACTRSRVPRS